VAWALALVAGGRALLALLPVGDAGNRSPFGAVGSLAPAALAAIALAVLCGALSASDGLAPFASLTTWVLAGALVVALAARALGPAGLVPRHPRVEAPLPRGVVLVSTACVLALLVFAALERPTLVWGLLAALLVEGGLERFAVAPLVRRVAAFVALTSFVAWVAAGESVDGAALVLALGAAAHGAGWIRRADRRDLALACLTAVGLSVVVGPVVGGIAALSIAAAARRPRLALVPVALALAASAAVALTHTLPALRAVDASCAALVAAAAAAARLGTRSGA
jgi:hypothetical protein